MNYNVSHNYDVEEHIIGGGCDEGYNCDFCGGHYESPSSGICIYCRRCLSVTCPDCAIFCHDESELNDYEEGGSPSYISAL